MEVLSAILVAAIATMLTRFIPFLIFRSGHVPGWVSYLGGVLPPAIMMVLIVYCYKDTSFTSPSLWLPGVLAGVLVIMLHKWKHNVLFSIITGTVFYMMLIQFIFI